MSLENSNTGKRVDYTTWSNVLKLAGEGLSEKFLEATRGAYEILAKNPYSQTLVEITSSLRNSFSGLFDSQPRTIGELRGPKGEFISYHKKDRGDKNIDMFNLGSHIVARGDEEVA